MNFMLDAKHKGSVGKPRHCLASKKNILRTRNKKGTFFSIGSPPIPVRRPWEAVCPAGESHT